VVLDVEGEDRRGVEVVHGDVEEALDLRGVEVERQDAVDARRLSGGSRRAWR
jgi:hypothetical protein